MVGAGVSLRQIWNRLILMPVIRNSLKWTIIKSGCTEIAGEDQFEDFIDASKALNKYQEYLDKYGWDPNCYIINPADHKSARIIRKYFLPMKYVPKAMRRLTLRTRVL